MQTTTFFPESELHRIEASLSAGEHIVPWRTSNGEQWYRCVCGSYFPATIFGNAAMVQTGVESGKIEPWRMAPDGMWYRCLTASSIALESDASNETFEGDEYEREQDDVQAGDGCDSIRQYGIERLNDMLDQFCECRG